MPRKEFPSDWSGLTDDEIRANIRYLYWHLSRLGVANLYAYDKISIGDIVLNHESAGIYSINGKSYSIDTKTGKKLKRLHNRCEERLLPFYAKKGPVICAASIVFGMVYPCVIGSSISLDKNEKIQKEVEPKVQEYAKTLPHYEEMLQTEAEIAHYKDSLWNLYGNTCMFGARLGREKD